MISRLILGTVGLAAMSTVALAADLPSRRAPPVYIPPPIPVFSWTGFYIGGQIGYGFGNDNAVLDASGILRTQPNVFGYGTKPNGIIGGAHVGYNFALPAAGFGNSLIVGVEGDVDGSDYRATSDLGAAIGGASGVLFNRTRNEINGSIRGRLGFAVDRALFYATGGAAFGDFKSSYFSPLANALLPQDFSHTRVGYTVGGGIEYAVTTQWSLRAEYRYTDFGTYTDVLNNGGGTSFPVRHRETQNKVQVGFSYKFDSPLAAPVVARY
jgi:outer membrane immunogenic protein